MIELSLINTPNQEFNAILNDQNCTIQVRFLGDNAYFSLWVDDDPIVQNVIMLPKEKILLYQSNFSGNFFIVDSTFVKLGSLISSIIKYPLYFSIIFAAYSTLRSSPSSYFPVKI